MPIEIIGIGIFIIIGICIGRLMKIHELEDRMQEDPVGDLVVLKDCEDDQTYMFLELDEDITKNFIITKDYIAFRVQYRTTKPVSRKN